MTEQRLHPVRRAINSIGMRDGEPQESKMFATVGKCLCVWLIYKYAEDLIDHENTLLVLMLFLIAPDLIKKFITMRFGGTESSTSSFIQHTERVDDVVQKGRVAADDPDGGKK